MSSKKIEKKQKIIGYLQWFYTKKNTTQLIATFTYRKYKPINLQKTRSSIPQLNAFLLGINTILIPSDNAETLVMTNTLVMTYPSTLNHIPILKLNLHNSILKALSLLQCCLSVSLLHGSWHFADALSDWTACWEPDW